MGSGILYNNVFLYIIPARACIRAVGIGEMGHLASLSQARRANKNTDTDSKKDTDSKNEFTSGPTLWFRNVPETSPYEFPE